MAKGLGKGLGALMAESQDEEIEEAVQAENGTSFAAAKESSTGVQVKSVEVKTKLPVGITADENGTLWVDPKLLKPNPRQPRQYFNEDDLRDLTESVRKEGVLQPIMIEDAGDGSFYIIAGERRTRASLAAGLEKVPVQLRKFSDVRKLEVALIENIQRTDLNPVEEAQAYYKLMEIGDLTQEQVAERVGKNRATVANYLRLLKLPEDMQRALVEGTLTSGHARALLSIDNPTDQRVLFGKIVGQGLSVRQAEAYAKEIKDLQNRNPSTGESAPKKDNRDPNYIDLENRFIQSLGTKVQLKGDLNKGTIVISYFSGDDLDRLFNQMCK